jgi:hypothetical protein
MGARHNRRGENRNTLHYTSAEHLVDMVNSMPDTEVIKVYEDGKLKSISYKLGRVIIRDVSEEEY